MILATVLHAGGSCDRTRAATIQHISEPHSMARTVIDVAR